MVARNSINDHQWAINVASWTSIIYAKKKKRTCPACGVAVATNIV